MSDIPKRSGKVNAHAYAQLIAALSEGPYNRRELADRTGLHELTVGHYVGELMRVKPKQVYIHHWDDAGTSRGHKTPSFKLGNLPDAKKPKPLTHNEIHRRYAAAKKLRVSSIFERGGIVV